MKVRKIAALAVGAAMVGATLGYASATMPGKEFFVKDGKPNVKIVVGANAPSTMDVASAADIALAVGSLLYTSEEVEASGVSVVVKKDVTDDPEDLTIYKYFYETVNGPITAEDWDDLPSDYWWNGSAYNGSYDDWVAAYQNDPWNYEVEDMDSLEGDYQIDWDFSLSEIHLIPTEPDDWEEEDDIAQPPKEAKLLIPEGGFKVLLNYTISNWSVEVNLGKDDQWGIPETESFNVIDDDEPDVEDIADEYDVDPSDVTVEFEGYVYEGVHEGESFTVLGNTYYVLDIGDQSFTYGKDHGEVWFKLGDTKDYDGYKVKAVDISVNENRALVEVTSPEGVDKLVILYKDEEKDVFDDGGIILTLTDTFVGIDGNLIATIQVVTNQKEIESGDELVSGWTATITTGTDSEDKKVIKWIELSNADDIEEKTVDVLGKYKVYYKLETYTEDESDVDYDINDDGDEKDELMTAEALIVIEPTERVYETKELKVGDKLEGWTIEAIKGETYTEVTLVPPTEPITVLDDEIDVNAVDSNLILVGGPVANAITKYLVEQGLSTVDWENSDGDIEYLEDVFGEYDVLIVAGKDRYATREAAKELMEYLAEL
ncbi:S-layer protein [Thermococcus aggregans]|uniref:S-layer protein n=1 Tax=Thermococcus aggregans TaxID=110163 RepID=A0A9E7MXF5_THEAG|nr:S-layer protein [Thermococcus aggregans]USS40597.1 S-layer protein [Thermococcus aggregans]